MQVVACGASIFNMILSLVKMGEPTSYCWRYYDDNFTLLHGETCHNIDVSHGFLFTRTILRFLLRWSVYFPHDVSKGSSVVFLFTCRTSVPIFMPRTRSFTWLWLPSPLPWQSIAARWSTAAHQHLKWWVNTNRCYIKVVAS